MNYYCQSSRVMETTEFDRWNAEVDFCKRGNDFLQSLWNMPKSRHRKTLKREVLRCTEENSYVGYFWIQFMLDNKNLNEVPKRVLRRGKKTLTTFINYVENSFGPINIDSDVRDWYSESCGWLGMIYVEEGEYHKAETYFAKTCDLFNIQSTVQHGNYLEYQDRFDEAIRLWDRNHEYHLRVSKKSKRKSTNVILGFIKNRLATLYIRSAEPQVRVHAHELFREAAELGDEDAQINLKMIENEYDRADCADRAAPPGSRDQKESSLPSASEDSEGFIDLTLQKGVDEHDAAEVITGMSDDPIDLMRKSAAAGNYRAREYLLDYYLNKNPKENIKAIPFLEQKHVEGNTTASWIIAKIIACQKNDWDRALRWISVHEQACKNGCTDCEPEIKNLRGYAEYHSALRRLH